MFGFVCMCALRVVQGLVASAMRASRRQHGLLVSLTVAALAAAHGRRIKVVHLSPFLGRHQGGLLINVTGTGASCARSWLSLYFFHLKKTSVG